MRSNPNWLAYAALMLWPFVSLTLYRTRPFIQATIWTILGAQLLLPELTAIKLEMIPAFDKSSIPNLCALAGCLLTKRHARYFKRRFGLFEILIVMLLVGPLITSLLNNDAIFVGGTVLPGVGPYDGLSASLGQLLFVLPLILGQRFLSASEANEQILRALIVAGIAYSLPMLFEVRMSPQLHRWIYGFFPSDFITEGRQGGFRPVVFMGKGLLVAFFMATCTVASASFWRAKTRIVPLPPAFVTFYLGVVLVLCKTAGALLYGIFLVPLVRLASCRLQTKIAILLVSIAMAYPVLRSADLFPDRSVLEFVSQVSPDRASSLKTRFDNEQQLLAHASERLLFGWGRYGRNRIYEENSGINLSLTDGLWIITLGTWGVFGFIAEFGLLALAVVRAAAALKYAESEREKIYLAALTLIVAISLFEQLPNASLNSWTWLLVGALFGRAQACRAISRQRRIPMNARPANDKVKEFNFPAAK